VLGLAVSLILTGAMFILLQSRASWAALFLTMILLGMIGPRRLRVPMVILACVLLLCVALLGPTNVAEQLLVDWNNAGAKPLKWSNRAQIWVRGLWVIADFPLTGPGMNMFRKLVPILYPLFSLPQGYDLAHAHNIYLQAAIDLGIPGLICFLALTGGTLSAGWQALRSSSTRLMRAILLGSMGGLIAFALWGTVDAISLGAKPGFVWWAVAALTIAANSAATGGDTT